jgi:hypothetical protein
VAPVAPVVPVLMVAEAAVAAVSAGWSWATVVAAVPVARADRTRRSCSPMLSAVLAVTLAAPGSSRCLVPVVPVVPVVSGVWLLVRVVTVVPVVVLVRWR